MTSSVPKKYWQHKPSDNVNYYTDVYSYNPFTDKLPSTTAGEHWKYIKYTLKNNDTKTTFSHTLNKNEIVDGKVWILCAGPGGKGGGNEDNGGGGGGGTGEITMHVIDNPNLLDNTLSCYMGSLNNKTRAEDTDQIYKKASSTAVFYNKILLENTVTTGPSYGTYNMTAPRPEAAKGPVIPTEVTTSFIGDPISSINVTDSDPYFSNTTTNVITTTTNYSYKWFNSGSANSNGYYVYNTSTINTTSTYNLSPTLVKATGGFKGYKGSDNYTGAGGGSGGGYRTGSDNEIKEYFNTETSTTIKFGSAGGGGGGGYKGRDSGDLGNQTKLYKVSSKSYEYKYLDRTKNMRWAEGVNVDFNVSLSGNNCDSTGEVTVLDGGNGGAGKDNGNNGPGGFILFFYKTNDPINRNEPLQKYNQEFPPFLNVYNYNPFTNKIPGQDLNNSTPGEDWVYYVYKTKNKDKSILFDHTLTDVVGNVWILCAGPGGEGGGNEHNGGGGGGGSGEITLHVVDNTKVLNNKLNCYIGSLNKNTRTDDINETYRTRSSTAIFYNKILSENTAVTTGPIAGTVSIEQINEFGISKPIVQTYTEVKQTVTGDKISSSNFTDVYPVFSDTNSIILTSTIDYTFKEITVNNNIYTKKYMVYNTSTVNDTIPYTCRPTLVKATGGFKGYNGSDHYTGAGGGSGGGYRTGSHNEIKEYFNTATATTFKFGSAGGGGGGGYNGRDSGDLGNQTKLYEVSGKPYEYKYLDRTLNTKSAEDVRVNFNISLSGNNCDTTGEANVIDGGNGGPGQHNGNNAPDGFIMIFHKTNQPLHQDINPPEGFVFGYNPFSDTIINSDFIHKNVLFYTNDTGKKTISKDFYNSIFDNSQCLIVGGGGGGGNTYWDGYESYGGGGGGSGGIQSASIGNINTNMVINVGKTGQTYDTPGPSRKGKSGEDGDSSSIEYNGITVVAGGGNGGQAAKYDATGRNPQQLVAGGDGGLPNGVKGGDGLGEYSYSVPIYSNTDYTKNNIIIYDDPDNKKTYPYKSSYVYSPLYVSARDIITNSGKGAIAYFNDEIYKGNRKLDLEMERKNGSKGGSGFIMLFGTLKQVKF